MRSALLALAAGALLPLAFAPVGWVPLALLLPAVLCRLWLDATPGRAAWLGFLFGFGQFLVGVSWVYHSMHDFGGMAPPLAGLAVLLFAAFLALYPAAVGWLQARSFWSPVPRLLLLLPVLWAAGEWLRGWLFTGFSWLALGYSQVGWPLAGVAPWFGVYGVSTVVAICAGLLALWSRAPRFWIWPAALALVWVAAYGAGLPRWVRPTGTPLAVALVQGNVPLQRKWDPAQRDLILQRYLELSRAQRDADLVVWPEAAVPGFLDQLPPDFTDALETEFRDHGTAFLFGTLDRDVPIPGARYYNAVRAVGTDGDIYRKHHLVPFGEYVPFAGLMGWLMGSLDIPMADVTPGPPPTRPLVAAGQPVGVSICYEDAFARDVLPLLPAATLLVNVSEDAWFGDSLGPHQRLQMARMRALESGRYMLRAANTGVSAVIDQHGRVLEQTPQFEERVLRATVQPLSGQTPFVAMRSAGVLGWLLLLVMGAVLAYKQRR